MKNEAVYNIHVRFSHYEIEVMAFIRRSPSVVIRIRQKTSFCGTLFLCYTLLRRMAASLGLRSLVGNVNHAHYFYLKLTFLSPEY
jgi:hypothetical protein